MDCGVGLIIYDFFESRARIEWRIFQRPKIRDRRIADCAGLARNPPVPCWPQMLNVLGVMFTKTTVGFKPQGFATSGALGIHYVV